MGDQSTIQARKSWRCFSTLKRNRLESWWQQSIHAIWNGFSEYSERSTIHGVRYLGERKRFYIEKVYWIVAFTVCAGLCGKFVNDVRWRWKYAPEIITYADEMVAVSQIPFPTITICSSMRVQTAVYDNINEILHQLLEVYSSDKNKTDFSEDILKRIQSLYVLAPYCKPTSIFNEIMQNLNISIDRNIYPYLKSLVENPLEFSKCRIFGLYMNCNEIFTPILMNGGLCYTFNQMGSAEMYKINSLADDFPFVKQFQFHKYENLRYGQPTISQNYPYHVKNHKSGLKLLMTLPKNGSEVCDGLYGTKELKIFVHAADEMPYLMSTSFDIPMNHKVQLEVNPNVKKTDKSAIAYYAIDDRKCIAEHEHDLMYFKKYSESYCLAEESIKKFFEGCGCVHFWMPRVNDSKVCDDYCLKFEHIFRNVIPKIPKCLPACNTISYDTEMAMKKMNLENGVEGYSREFNFVDVTISFKNEKTIAWRQSGMYGFGLLNFLAGCGGILGLFMGVSVLSILEVIYSFTIRPYCDFWREKLKRKNWLQTLEQSENRRSTIRMAEV